MLWRLRSQCVIIIIIIIIIIFIANRTCNTVTMVTVFTTRKYGMTQ